MKNIIIFLLHIISTYCIVFVSLYSTKLGILKFFKSGTSYFSVIIVLLLLNIFIVLIDIKKMNMLEKQNRKLKKLMLSLSKQSNDEYDSTCNYILNNRELELDIFNELSGRRMNDV